MKEGLAGHVATTNKVINVADAYSDNRFNPEIDHRSGYVTKTVLGAPIFDGVKEHSIGVIQAINKRSGGHFSKNDESIL